MASFSYWLSRTFLSPPGDGFPWPCISVASSLTHDDFKTRRRISQWVRKKRMLWCHPNPWVKCCQLCHSPLLSIKSHCHTHRGVYKGVFHRDMTGDIWQTLAGKYNSEFSCYNQTKNTLMYLMSPNMMAGTTSCDYRGVYKALEKNKLHFQSWSERKDFQTSSYGAILTTEGKVATLN